MSTLYRCSGYVEEICKKCPLGQPHEKIDCVCDKELECDKRNRYVTCIEYDRGPCGDLKCPDCAGGDGVSCKE